MNRFAIEAKAVCVGAFLMILAGSCGDREATLGPVSYQGQHSFSTAAVGLSGELLGERSIFIAIPETREVREIRHPLISEAVLSMVPRETLGRLAAKGIVFIDDWGIAEEIVMISGMSTSNVSGGIWLGLETSWSCVKACYGPDPPCMTCPQCCDKEKDKEVDIEMQEH